MENVTIVEIGKLDMHSWVQCILKASMYTPDFGTQWRDARRARIGKKRPISGMLRISTMEHFILQSGRVLRVHLMCDRMEEMGTEQWRPKQTGPKQVGLKLPWTGFRSEDDSSDREYRNLQDEI